VGSAGIGPQGPTGSQLQAKDKTYTHTTTLPPDPSRPGYVMDEARYERIQGRIRKEMGRWAPQVSIAGAFASLGVAVSALLAYLVLPRHTTGLPAGAQGIIAVIAIAAGVLFLVFMAGYLVVSRRGNEAAIDICDEMDHHAGIIRPVVAPPAHRLRFYWPVQWNRRGHRNA